MGGPVTVPALSVRGMSKRFGAVEALDEVGLEIRRGDVHGLVGANGSGKSTLVKVLAGYHVPDSGNMHAWGRPVALPVADAGRHGIAVIHQDLGLIDELSVTENVIGTTGFGTAPWLPIRWDGQRERVAALLRRLGIDIDPRTEVGDLSRGERTLVAVARAVSELEGAAQERLLVTDEPTAALSSSEAGAVWGLLRRVTSEGGAALFISHHLQEVRLRCDCVTVLRDGRVVLTAACADVTEADLVTAMLGTSGVNMTAPQLPDVPAPSIAQDALLEVQSLTDARLSDVTFAAHAGEVIGVTGLLGMGQERIPALLSGAARRASGDVRVAGRSLPPGDDRAAAGAGLVTVPAERQRDGLWMDGSVAENLGIVRAGAFFVRGRYDRQPRTRPSGRPGRALRRAAPGRHHARG